MFCRGTGHFTDNCPKKTKKAKAHTAAILLSLVRQTPTRVPTPSQKKSKQLLALRTTGELC